MVEHVPDFLGGKAGVDCNQDRPQEWHREVGQQHLRNVRAQECDPVALSYAGLCESVGQPGRLAGHLRVSDPAVPVHDGCLAGIHQRRAFQEGEWGQFGSVDGGHVPEG